MENFLSRLARNPYAPIDGASITRVDELGNGYDDFGQMIQPKFEAPEQTWGETALGVATAPARIATALADSVSPYGSEGWRMPPIIDEGVNALSAVGDAYTQGMSEDEMRNRALGMASFMFAGGGPAVALEKSLTQKPVTVRGYHGTRSEFDKFNGPSVYASENPDAASEWAMVANRDGEAPNVLPLDITALNPYYAKSLFPDQAELDRIAAADPDVVFYPPSTQHGTTFDKYPGQVFEARKPGTVRSATTGETLYSNASKEGAIPALLDMGQEARLARARDMGFDTDTTWYHGTTGDFDAFNSKMYGSTTGADGAKKAAFFASDPDIASAYVGLAPSRDYTDLVKMQEQAMAKGNSAEFDRIEGILENFQQEGVPTGGNIIPARLPNNMQTFDFYGKPWEDGAMVSAIDNARAAGLPGVVFKNIADHPYDNTRLSSVAAVFDPRNIRSVNAAFDPAKSDSANLLAANADSRPALLGAGQEQDIPDWLLPYLR